MRGGTAIAIVLAAALLFGSGSSGGSKPETEPPKPEPKPEPKPLDAYDVTPGAIPDPAGPLGWYGWWAGLVAYLDAESIAVARALASAAKSAGANAAWGPLQDAEAAIASESLPQITVFSVKLAEALTGPGRLFPNAPVLEEEIISAYAKEEESDMSGCVPRTWGFDAVKPSLDVESPSDFGFTLGEWEYAAAAFWELATNKRPWCTTWAQVSSLPLGEMPLWQNLGSPPPHLQWMGVEMYYQAKGALPPDLATAARWIDLAGKHTT